MAGPKRYRNWAFVFYPGDSAPDNWLEILRDLHIAGFISPFHNLDHNPDDTEKKSHRHCILMYDGVKSLDQVRADIAPLHCPIPIPVKSLKGYARYLVHADNPEKVQYSPDDVICLGGAEYDQYIGDSPMFRHKELIKMRQFIKDHDIYSFSQFYDYCDMHNPDWSAMLDDNSTMCISNYIKSRIYDRREILVQQVQELQSQNTELRRLALSAQNANNQLAHNDPFKDC